MVPVTCSMANNSILLRKDFFVKCWMQILLRNRTTKVNAQMHDGTTPLMLAVRLAVEGMVEELINADADVNACDAQGNQCCYYF